MERICIFLVILFIALKCFGQDQGHVIPLTPKQFAAMMHDSTDAPSFFQFGSNYILSVQRANGIGPTNGILVLKGLGTNTSLYFGNYIEVTNATIFGSLTNLGQEYAPALSSSAAVGMVGVTASGQLVSNSIPISGIAQLNGKGTNTYLTNATVIIQGSGSNPGLSFISADGLTGSDRNSLYITDTGTPPYGEFDNFVFGLGNDVQENSFYDVVIGGSTNIIGGFPSVVPMGSIIAGGVSNTVLGSFSQVFGTLVHETHDRGFVVNESKISLESTTNGSATFNVPNGFYINTTNSSTNALQVHGWVNSDSGFTVNGAPFGNVPANLLTNTATAAAPLIVTNSGSVAGVGFTNGGVYAFGSSIFSGLTTFTNTIFLAQSQSSFGPSVTWSNAGQNDGLVLECTPVGSTTDWLLTSTLANNGLFIDGLNNGVQLEGGNSGQASMFSISANGNMKLAPYGGAVNLTVGNGAVTNTGALYVKGSSASISVTNNNGTAVFISTNQVIVAGSGTSSTINTNGFIGDGSGLTSITASKLFAAANGNQNIGITNGANNVYLFASADSFNQTNFYFSIFGNQSKVDLNGNWFFSGSMNGNGSGLTNIESLTIQTTTNLSLNWNGSVQKFVITNTPNFYLTWGAGWGDASFYITTSNNLFGGLFNNPAVNWISGSNPIVTNTALLSVSSFGTNYIRVTMVQP